MIAEFLFKRPRILILVLALIVIAGVNSFLATPRLEDPVLGRRVGVVSTIYPGADVLQVETLVTNTIEARLGGVADIKQIRSTTRNGISNVVVELADEVTEFDRVWADVESQIAALQTELPESAWDPELTVFPLRSYTSIVAVKSKSSGDGTDKLALLGRLAEELRSEILNLDGTQSVKAFGAPGEEMVVELQPQRLAAMNQSLASIASQLQTNMTQQPGGKVGGAENQNNIVLDQNDLPSKRVGESSIRLASGESVPLQQFALIEKRTRSPLESIALIDKQAVVALGVLVDNDQQVDRWNSKLEDVVQRFQTRYGHDGEFEILFSQSKHIENRMSVLAQNLGIGTAAVALVVLVLMGWRSMLVVGLALPFSALMVMSGMKLMSIPIHQMSVTGLIVAMGLLIDNAIVMVDEVRAKIIQGHTKLDAIYKSVKHLGMPLFGSTLTTALAFLPIATLPGPSGEFVGTIAVSVILAICSSFVLAMTLIPAANGLLHREVQAVGDGERSYGLTLPPLRSIYKKSLAAVFRFPVIGVLLGAILPVAGFLLATQLAVQFFPPSDRNQIQIEVECASRSGTANTRTSVEAIHDIVSEHEGVAKQYWFVGQSAPTFYYNVVPRRRGTPFYAQAIVDVEQGASTVDVVRGLQESIDRRAFSSRTIVRQLEQGPPFDAPIEVRVVGPDLEVLARLGDDLRKVLFETNNVIHTRSDQSDVSAQLALNLDDQAMADVGLNKSQVMGHLFTTLEGASAGKVVDETGKEIPLVVKLAASDDAQLDFLKALPIPVAQSNANANANRPPAGPPPSSNQTGPATSMQTASFPTLSNVGDFELKSGGGAIIHVDGKRVNEVKAYIRAGVLPSVVLSDFKEQLAKSDFELPSGYQLQLGGETEQRSHAVNSLIANAVLLFVLMLLSMIASFQSFRCALIIAIVGGLSVGLGPLALWLFGYPFGFMAIVGTMGLVGIAINDSIVVLAAIRANYQRSEDRRQSLVEVVNSCTRHILATTLTTIAGFLPLILAGGGFWPPLAITIAGGVAGATILALYVVPSLYLLFVPSQKNLQRLSDIEPSLITRPSTSG